MRETPTEPARALGNRPSDTMLKRRESIAKQDRKNLNHNAPRPKMPYGVSDSSPFQGPLFNNVNVEGCKPTNPEPAQNGGARSHGSGRRRHSQADHERSTEVGRANHYERL